MHISIDYDEETGNVTYALDAEHAVALVLGVLEMTQHLIKDAADLKTFYDDVAGEGNNPDAPIDPGFYKR